MRPAEAVGASSKYGNCSAMGPILVLLQLIYTREAENVAFPILGQVPSFAPLGPTKQMMPYVRIGLVPKTVFALKGS